MANPLLNERELKGRGCLHHVTARARGRSLDVPGQQGRPSALQAGKESKIAAGKFANRALLPG